MKKFRTEVFGMSIKTMIKTHEQGQNGRRYRGKHGQHLIGRQEIRTFDWLTILRSQNILFRMDKVKKMFYELWFVELTIVEQQININALSKCLGVNSRSPIDYYSAIISMC